MLPGISFEGEIKINTKDSLYPSLRPVSETYLIPEPFFPVKHSSTSWDTGGSWNPVGKILLLMLLSDN